MYIPLVRNNTGNCSAIEQRTMVKLQLHRLSYITDDLLETFLKILNYYNNCHRPHNNNQNNYIPHTIKNSHK